MAGESETPPVETPPVDDDATMMDKLADLIADKIIAKSTPPARTTPPKRTGVLNFLDSLADR